MQFTTTELAWCEQHLINKNSSEKQYWENRIKLRLDQLNPLISEISRKGINLNDLSKDLNDEYNKLVFLNIKYIL